MAIPLPYGYLTTILKAALMRPEDDIRARLDEALATKGGIRIPFDDSPEANAFRMRAYAFRRHDRAESRRIYPPGHESYDASPYDALTIRVIGPATVIIEPRAPIPQAIPNKPSK